MPTPRRETVPLTVKVRQSQKDRLSAPLLRDKIGPIIRVLLDMYLAGLLDPLEVEQYISDEVYDTRSKDLNKKKGGINFD